MPLNIDWQQILLHLLNFVILFAVLYFLLYKPVKQFMNKRTEHYENLDREAREKLAAAEKAEAEHARLLSGVGAEIAAEKEKAHRELEASLAAKKKQAEEDAARILADAQNAAEREHEKILKETQNEITDMVALATEKIVLRAGTSEAFDQFLAAAERGENDA